MKIQYETGIESAEHKGMWSAYLMLEHSGIKAQEQRFWQHVREVIALGIMKADDVAESLSCDRATVYRKLRWLEDKEADNRAAARTFKIVRTDEQN